MGGIDEVFQEIDRETMVQLVDGHEGWRRECINLTASENALSSSVRRYLNCDLVQRYGDYTARDLSARRYQGNKWIERIERAVAQLAGELFGAKYVELRAISGHIAGAAVLMGLTGPGDIVLEVGRDGGGHRLAAKLALAPLIDLQVHFLPFDPFTYNIDLDRTLKMVEELRPCMVVLGSSSFLFPHPVRELSEALQRYPQTLLVYDASHVFGLIAGGRFQNPLAEGARVVFGSTHKTLPGPQGGIILSNEDELMDRIVEALYPALVTNHHLFRLPALGVCLLEMKRWGAYYADQIIANAQALGQEIQSRGIDVVGYLGRFSQSHTILVRTVPYGSSKEIATRLEEANIIVTAARLPEELGIEGVRIGTQEITRLGAREDDMEPLAELLLDVITGRKSPVEVLPLAKEYARQFQNCRFTWNRNCG